MSDHNEHANTVPHMNTPTGLIQANESPTVSTITDDEITQLPSPTSTVNNQMSALSEVNKEEANQQDVSVAEDEEEKQQQDTSQISEHNIELTPDNIQGKQENDDSTIQDDDEDGMLNEEMDAKYGSRTTRWNLRQRKPRTYDHRYDENAAIYVVQSTDASLATPQVPIRRGLKMFRTTGDTIPTRYGRELGEIWVSKVGTNF